MLKNKIYLYILDLNVDELKKHYPMYLQKESSLEDSETENPKYYAQGLDKPRVRVSREEGRVYTKNFKSSNEGNLNMWLYTDDPDFARDRFAEVLACLCNEEIVE